MEKQQQVGGIIETSTGVTYGGRRFKVVQHNELGDKARSFQEMLGNRVIGQPGAVDAFSGIYQICNANMQMQGRPLGTMLFLGPTGTGKTRVVEAAAEVLFGSSKAVVKIDCAEFQHSHEIAKLVGSPPGYLGHRETSPLLTQENLDRHHTDRDKITFVLFDEIEKASDSLWQLLLGVLDKATLTLGDNRRVDFSRCVIVMTSNLGAAQMAELINGTGIGFTGSSNKAVDTADLKKVAVEAARRKFSPEFFNRLDSVVVFNQLVEEHLRQILDLELSYVNQRIVESDRKFQMFVTQEFKDFLLQADFDLRYGARNLKRAIDKYLVKAIANLAATDQLASGDLLMAGVLPDGELVFAVEEFDRTGETGTFDQDETPTLRLEEPQPERGRHAVESGGNRNRTGQSWGELPLLTN